MNTPQMNTPPGLYSVLVQARAPKVDNSRLKHLADLAEQIDQEERAQAFPALDQFQGPVRNRLESTQGNAFHPYQRETAQPALPPMHAPLSESANKIDQSAVSFLKAIWRTPNPKDRHEALESVLGTARSKYILARRMILSALVGNATNISARLDHPEFDLNVKEAAVQTIHALRQAVMMGHLDVVKTILEHPKVMPDIVNYQSFSKDKAIQPSLSTAIDCGQEQIARYLLGHPKVNVNQPSGDLSTTPLYKAIVKNPALVKDILNHPQLDLAAPAERPQGAVALVAAACSNQSEIFDQLLDHPKMSKDIVNWTNPKGENALFKILFHSRNDFAQTLRQHPKFDLNHRLPSRETALVKAAEVGNLKAVQQYLQESSLDLAAGNQDVQALFAAGIEGHYPIYDLLRLMIC